MPDLTLASTYADCQGCSLCLLPCPMWRQHHDVMFSPQGMAKAMQSGVRADDMKEVLNSCIACGACDVMCPENIDLSGMIRKQRQEAGLEAYTLKVEDDLSPFMVSCDVQVQEKINENDLYIIDASSFHAHYTERVGYYDDLRKRTGCKMNLDLNRVAIATGIESAAAKRDLFDVKEQVQWLIQGRSFNRVVVENVTEVEVLRELTGKPVVCVTELLGSLQVRGENAAG